MHHATQRVAEIKHSKVVDTHDDIAPVAVEVEVEASEFEVEASIVEEEMIMETGIAFADIAEEEAQ
jgi:hypothetical protein